MRESRRPSPTRAARPVSVGVTADRADRAASHVGQANSGTMITDQIEKNERFVSFHRGLPR